MSLDSRPLDADQIVDRRRLRRKLTFWRVLTVLVVIAAIGAVAAMSRQGAFTGGTSGAIARVTISGLIRGNQPRVEAIERLANSSAKAVIVHIDSPGGTTAGVVPLLLAPMANGGTARSPSTGSAASTVVSRER